jgi:polysaccharide pyruvyl transferase WcaK-like protein
MILAIVTFTNRIARKPITMLNIGVGPVSTPRGLRIARRILSQVDVLTVRDEKSRATCESIGVIAVRATDAVFSADRTLLVGENPPAITPSSGALRVALNLNFDIENPDNWELFQERLATALELVNAKQPIELHALPMQAGFKEHDDTKILDAFATRVPSIPFVRHELPSHTDAARLIDSCDLVISERLHAIVMASILGVPSYVLAYDVKVTQLAAMLGLDSWSVNINEPFDATVVGDRILELIEQRAAVASAVEARSAELGDEARANFAKAREWVASVR